jgi:17beta-estradiol 17-dehydrogenase / very-long-chain 3-oxoacyl-CoA reductase
LIAPTSERFAKAAVARIGCGRRRITPWMPHAVLQWLMTTLGETAMQGSINHEVSNILKQVIKDE